MNYLYAQTSSGGGILGFLPFVLILLVIYFLMLRPQMKQQKDRKVMLENLKKGDIFNKNKPTLPTLSNNQNTTESQ